MSLIQVPIMPENYNDVIEYSYSAEGFKKLSQHFYVKDFKTNESDRILISNKLIKTLEIIFKYLRATSCKVLSGYRTAREEALKTQTFQDPHVMGTAADVIYYLETKPIDSRQVCIALQELGFEGGAAPIGEKYEDGKVQIEVSGKRYFNKNTSLPEVEIYSADKGGFHEAADYKKQYEQKYQKYQIINIEGGKTIVDAAESNTPVYGITASLEKPKRGIDVSSNNGVLDWSNLKNKIDFVIIRCGYGMDLVKQDDSQFKNNVEAAEKYNIPYGVYLYSYANTLEKAESEARHALRLVKQHCKKICLPIFLDLEASEANGDKITVGGTGSNQTANLLKQAQAFCKIIEDAGYSYGTYTNIDWINNKIKISQNSWYGKYPLWIARWFTENWPSYDKVDQSQLASSNINKVNNSLLGYKASIWQAGAVIINGKAFDWNWIYVNFGSTGKGNIVEAGTINSGIIYGDLNEDGKINDEDEALLAGYLSKNNNLTDIQKKKADLNGDGKIDENDIKLLSYYKSNLGEMFLQIGDSGALMYQNPTTLAASSLGSLLAGTRVALDTNLLYMVDDIYFIRIKYNGVKAYIRLSLVAGYDQIYNNRTYFDENGKPINSGLFFELSKYIFDFKTQGGTISSGMSKPFNGAYHVSQSFGHNGHHGVDIVADADTTIYAVKGGTVRFAGKGTGNNVTFGNYVSIDIGSAVAYYAHLSSISVKTGQTIATGQKIGIEGKTGEASGYHLHYAIKKDGSWVNPKSYLPSGYI